MNSKDMLAKLLATENIRVMRGECKTASFDVDKRVLRLPIWKDMSSDVEDLMIGHEVGHALYTDDVKFADFDSMKKSIFNILEDNRIERMIKSTYPGLRGNFTAGYKELYDKEFFGKSSEHFLDKVNVKSKVGLYANIEFDNTKEDELFELANKTKLISDVYNLTDIYYDYIEDKEYNDNTKKILSAESQDSFDSKLNEMVDLDSKYKYVKFSDKFYQYTKDPDGIIGYKRMIELWKPTEHIPNNSSKFNKFMSETTNIVNHMTSIFIMKQSADTRKREQEYKSGELNMSKIFGYKTSDNIFQTFTHSSTGKNHGLVVLLDLSGSITNELPAMIKQVITLVLFCRRNKIKHQILGFVNNQQTLNCSDADNVNYDMSKFKLNSSLLEIFSDKMSNIEFTNMAKLLILVNTKKYGLRLCGTPLNESLLSLNTYLPKYKDKNNIDKLSLMILTDGCSDSISSVIGDARRYSSVIIHDDSTKLDYMFNSGNSIFKYTETLLKSLKDKVKVDIGYIYISPGKNSREHSNISSALLDNFNLIPIKSQSETEEYKGAIVDRVYIVGKNDLMLDNTNLEDEEEDIEESFMSDVSTIKNSRVIMNSFINLIS